MRSKFYSMLDYIVWDVDPTLFKIGGLDVRWYGLFFASALLLSHYIMSKIYKIEERTSKELDWLAFYLIVGTIVGARLGHVLFYGPYHTPENDGYFDNPISILNIREGGLASHGAAIGILLAAYLFTRKYKLPSYLWLMDRLVILVAISGCFIRTGNLMNSEIIGLPTESSMGMVFVEDARYYFGAFKQIESMAITKDENAVSPRSDRQALIVNITFQKDSIMDETEAKRLLYDDMTPYFNHIDIKNRHLEIDAQFATPIVRSRKGVWEMEFKALGIPRHASQLYEAISSFLIFAGLLLLYLKFRKDTPEGLLFGLFCSVLFTLRFIYEIYKENQVAMEDGMTLNMGQKLSIPLVIIGLYVLFRSYKKYKQTTKNS